MSASRHTTEHLLPLVLVMLTGAVLWYAHALAWDLGGRSPILSYDSAQYALAAREQGWLRRIAAIVELARQQTRKQASGG